MSTTRKLPTCIGFIMDGNRRWAKERTLATLEGHRRGYETFLRVTEYLSDAHISHGVFYAFSSENWNRGAQEVSYLMGLFEKALSEESVQLKKKNVRVKIIGDRKKFSKKLQSLMTEIEDKTAGEKGTTVWVLLSYGGRAEIVDAVNRAIVRGEKVTEKSFGKHLWTLDMPDPDIIVRTSGEQRLSNFLPWQSVYSELYFTNTYWPDFGKEEFDRMLEEYGKRQRREGT